MKFIRTMAAVVGAASLVAACGGGGHDLGKELGLQDAEIHFVHAIPSGPTVDFLVNNTALQKGISYKNVTNFTNIGNGQTTVAYTATGTTTICVEIIPGTAPTTYPAVVPLKNW